MEGKNELLLNEVEECIFVEWKGKMLIHFDVWAGENQGQYADFDLLDDGYVTVEWSFFKHSVFEPSPF